MRAAADLRTRAVSNYDRLEPLAMLLLALAAAAGVMLTWAEGFRWSRHGWEYGHGIAALAAAAGAAAVCVLRASGTTDRNRYVRLTLACALVGLGSTLVFYVDVIGSTDLAAYRTLIEWFSTPTIAGAIGLYVSMAAFAGQVGVLIWHRAIAIRRYAKLALESSWMTAAFVAIAALGVLLPWQRDIYISERGWSFNEGLIALVAAIEAGIVCGLRLSGRVGLLPYAAVALLWAMAGFGAVAWFHFTVAGETDPTGYRLLVWWLNAPRTEAGLQESVSAAGFIGVMSILTWQLWQGRHVSN